MAKAGSFFVADDTFGQYLAEVGRSAEAIGLRANH
jgi:creatinine amidohydrolase/Fe(II)-dependent formamide hydrolase-like protein